MCMREFSDSESEELLTGSSSEMLEFESFLGDAGLSKVIGSI